MVAIAGIVLTAVLIAMLEVPAMRKRRLKKELFLFFAILLLAAGIGIAQSLHITLPNPLDWVAAVYGPIGRLVDSALK
ncbi:hypothetical protein D3P09_23495 [Paenibacillus pinisoli]|uniref:Uncharacterized protein n=1 Tax=Paenibacillus pinisoli TaxID=1276110 RepID=A0A3A6PBS2_9BACL|nr:hypothetical protein [Paenibacillus pinisoli]RJX37320.1 hypothetical protein D3P09_23495 [Paenibacillus pinisoli]